jgi:hypothetical protein
MRTEEDGGQRTEDGGQEKGDREQGTGDKGADESKLGTGMVPNAPQVTARQIAGPMANQAAAMAMANALKGQGQPGEGQGESPSEQEGEATATGKKGGATKAGKTAANQKSKAGETESGEAAQADGRATGTGSDAATIAGGVAAEPWFARLPPELRSVIQAKTRGKAPRGYEERLRRYFESVD